MLPAPPSGAGTGVAAADLRGTRRLSACVRISEIGDALTAPSVRAAAVPPAVPESAPDGVHGQDAALVAGSVDRTFRSSAGDRAALRDVSLVVPRDSVVALDTARFSGLSSHYYTTEDSPAVTHTIVGYPRD
ncbi:hypothetical protein ABT126_05545 [Streptomyces sp. NPDC002012]|uniref:hypothetical protein n=1 Tax=Streptomyces sp. NPDC002012 TaxID=3154532 RepID=UPI00332B37B8